MNNNLYNTLVNNSLRNNKKGFDELKDYLFYVNLIYLYYYE